MLGRRFWLIFAIKSNNMDTTKPDYTKIGNDIIGSAFDTHQTYGRLLLESFYEGVMEVELKLKGHTVQRQVPIPAFHKRQKVTDRAYVADTIVDGCVLIEYKTQTTMCHDEFRQIMTYMKVAGIKLGYLINFGVKDFSPGSTKDKMPWSQGIYRCVNGF